MVSVIIPCYNGFRYMEKCLAALERQTNQDFEVIIVDDGSTDGSYEALEQFRGSSGLNIKLIKNAVNLGPGKSREIGINNSSGDQVAFCDCDDWYELQFIDTMTGLLNRENADIALCDNYRVKENNKIPAGATIKLGECKSKEDILAYAPMSLCRTIIKRELIMSVRFLNLYYGEDGVVLLQLIANADKLVFTTDALYNYLVRETSASQNPAPRVLRDCIEGYIFIRDAYGEQYPLACEFIGIKNVVYAATLGAFKSGAPTGEVKKIAEDFYAENPRYIHNKYMAILGRAKKIYIHCIYRRCYFICRMLTSIHKLRFTGRRGLKRKTCNINTTN